MKTDLLFLQPVFKSMIWGGNRLAGEFGYEIPSDTTGECWAVSAHEHGDCVITNGEYAGKTLSFLWKNHKELFGNPSGDRFPLLVKIIDAKQDLSIQVHPDDAYAKEHENGSFGKTECWYILDADPGATIVIGHHAKTKEEMKTMIQEHRWTDFIRTIPVKKGDFFQINPGTVHAIKGGTLILETQQNSDITYRVYDYDRLTNGKPRELHVEKSMDVITCPYSEQDGNHAEAMSGLTVGSGQGNVEFKQLISCPYYSVYHLKLAGTVSVEKQVPYAMLSVVDGEGTINQVPVKKGQHLIAVDGTKKLEISGKLELICSNP